MLIMIIKNAKIFTITSGIVEGDILIEGNIIKKIGNISEQSELKNNITDEHIINAKGKIVMPGFINTHCHAAMYFMKSSGRGLPVDRWLNEKIWPIENKMTPNDMKIGTKRSCIDMIKNGITCFSDMYYETDSIAKAVEEIGIRCRPSWCFIGPLPNGKTNKDQAQKFIENIKPTELIRPIISAHATHTCSTETLELAKKAAEEKNLPLDIHVSENQSEVDQIIKRENLRPVEYLEKIKFLSSRVFFDHGIHFSDNELNIIKKHNVKISHCPASNQWLNSGIIKLKEMLELEITVSLGTDSIASNDQLSIQHEMKKAREIQDWKIPAKTLVKMATINGAITLELDKEIGSIEEGKKADLIILDSTGDWEDIINAKINTVICNGKILMENYKLMLNEKEIIEDFEKAKEKLLEKTK
jgi:5-methylthioadenosine/S-adenosylhomocysteine deaminase